MEDPKQPPKEWLRAKDGGFLVLGIRAKRVGIGVKVTLRGGAEVARIIKACAQAEGYTNPMLEHGFRTWANCVALNYHNLHTPEHPQLGPWILRHADLGGEKPLELILQFPHSETYVTRECRNIKMAALDLYTTFSRLFVVDTEASVQTQPVAQEIPEDAPSYWPHATAQAFQTAVYETLRGRR